MKLLLKIRIKKSLKIYAGWLLTVLFYFLIFLSASLLLSLGLYLILRIDSTLSTFIASMKNEPSYLILYFGLTVGMILLFGANAALFVFRVRRYGLPGLKNQTGAGIGSFVALLSSACPVCGSTILSVLGFTGGLAAFPFGGLELKAASFGLMAIPVFLTVRDIKRKGCVGKVCPVPRDASFKKKDLIWLANILLVLLLVSIFGWNKIKFEPIVVNAIYPNNEVLVSERNLALQKEVRDKLFPAEGIKMQIITGDLIPKMVSLGIIDIDKFHAQYANYGGIPNEVEDLLTKPSDTPIVITSENQQWLVTILWPLGLSNKMEVNRDSPVAGKSLFSFASTGGWILGRENGGFYFNKYDLIPLSPDQESRVKTIAESTFRPCCNNSTFFQDCNHGSAALGIVELGVKQGLSDGDIYKNVLVFNSYWFSQSYMETALFFKEFKKQDWESLDPKMLLSEDYSTASGWAQNIHSEVVKVPGLVPAATGASSCGT